MSTFTLENSVHPYLDNTDETQVGTIAGAANLYVTFDPASQVEMSYDFVYVLDGADNQIATWNGARPTGPITVPGDTVKIRLTSDESYDYYGYLASITDEAPPPPPPVPHDVQNVQIALLDPVNYTKAIWDLSGDGPYLYGGKKFVAIEGTAWVDDYGRTSVYGTTDNGLTFSIEDPTNRPNFQAGIGSAWDGHGDYFWLAWHAGGGTYSRQITASTFNMASRTFGTPVDGPLGFVSGVQVDSHGVCWVLFNWMDDAYPHAYHLGVVSFNGSAWGTPVEITPLVTGDRAECFRMDPADKLHIVCTAVSGAARFHYFQFDTTTSALTEVGDYSFGIRRFIGYASFLGSKLVVPCIADEGGYVYKPAIIVIEPYNSTSPTVSTPLIVDDSFTAATWDVVQTCADAGHVYIFYINQTYLGGEFAKDEIDYVAYDGSNLSSPVVYHDEIAFPANPGQSNQFIHDLQAPVTLDGGRFAVIFALELGVLCVGYYTETSPPSLRGGFSTFGRGHSGLTAGTKGFSALD